MISLWKQSKQKSALGTAPDKDSFFSQIRWEFVRDAFLTAARSLCKSNVKGQIWKKIMILNANLQVPSFIGPISS